MRRLVLLLVVLFALPAFGQAVSKGRVGAVASSLTNTAQVLLKPMPVRTVTYCVIVGGAANQTVVFRGVGGSPTYATVAVAAGQTIARAMAANVPAGGLEVVTQGAAGDVTVECLYRFGP